jgi:FkbM family methyltransferase
MEGARLRTIAHKVTAPIRGTAVPVLRGNGRGLRVRFGESNLSRITRNGEPAVEDRFLEVLEPGDVVYDIGANIGWYSLLAARRVGPTGRVLAFEPGIANAAVIERNAATNRFANLSVVPAAVSDEDGWATFLDKGSLMSRLDKDDDEEQANRRAARKQDSRGKTTVPVLALDTWITQTKQPPPTLVKIDVEGAEIGVLRGMTKTLRSAKPTLIIELHGTKLSVADLLDSADYEHKPIERDVPTRDAPWGVHLLAHPRAPDNADSHGS